MKSSKACGVTGPGLGVRKGSEEPQETPACDHQSLAPPMTLLHQSSALPPANDSPGPPHESPHQSSACHPISDSPGPIHDSPHQSLILDSLLPLARHPAHLQDAAALRAALHVFTGSEHAQGHAVEHDDQHTDVLEPRGSVLRIRAEGKAGPGITYSYSGLGGTNSEPSCLGRARHTLHQPWHLMFTEQPEADRSWMTSSPTSFSIKLLHTLVVSA